jgi:subtilisin family serine protease
LVQEPNDREKVKEFVAVTVDSRRRLSGATAAEEIETFVHLDRLVTIQCTVMMAAELSNLDNVVSVVMDLGMYASVHYNWGNDRSDQDALPESHTFSPLATGKGQRVYIIDTGITVNHEEFAYGARAVHGWNFVDNKEDTTDGHSHGTHCAGSAVGSSVGMAPDATAVGVRVLNNNGAGSSRDVIKGLEWSTADAIERAIVGIFSLSLGGPADSSMDNAVSATSAKGMIPVVAAGK